MLVFFKQEKASAVAEIRVKGLVASKYYTVGPNSRATS